MVDFDEGRELLQLEKNPWIRWNLVNTDEQLTIHGEVWIHGRSMAYSETHSHVVTIHLSKQINELKQEMMRSSRPHRRCLHTS